MEVDTRLKELEEEIKVLKAEVRNVLLDIREVILERSNPLGEEHESAFIRMDLRTTAQAMAAEAAGREAGKVMDEAEAEATGGHMSEDGGQLAVAPYAEDNAEAIAESEPDSPERETGAPVEEEGLPPPKVIRRDPRELKLLAEEKEHETEVPPMYRAEVPAAYRAELPPISGNSSISAWLAESLDMVGPVELRRIISIHLAWGNLPPNINRALLHVQDLLEETEGSQPAWLRVMQDLDRIAAI